MVLAFEEHLANLTIHHFKAIHQDREIRMLKQQLKNGECLLHVDFSENLSTKISTEVQAAHFGDRHQIVIHQGLAY